MNDSKIYVGTYAKYNNGNLAGGWMNLADYDSKDEFYEACKELHSDEEDPEFMFQDWEEIPNGLIGESWLSDNFFDLRDIVDEDHIESFNAYCNHLGHDLGAEDAQAIYEDFLEAYQGEYSNDKDFAREMAENIGAMDEGASWPNNCIDWEIASRELMFDYFSEEGFYFRCL